MVRHGITFEAAVRIFEGPTLERVDDRFDYGETRMCAIGIVNSIEITVIYTDDAPAQASDHFGMEGRAT